MNFLLIWNLFNFVVENLIKCILFFVFTFKVFPSIRESVIFKNIRFLKFRSFLILFNNYLVSFCLLTLFITISPYSIIIKEISLVMSCILFMLYSIVIFY